LNRIDREMGEQGGANMWSLLLDKDPGHSAAAGDLAVNVVDRKLKKAGATPVDIVDRKLKKAAVTPVEKADFTPVDVVDRKLKKAGVTPVDVVDRKLKKAAVTHVDVEVAKPAKHGQMVKKEKLGAAGDDKQARATVNGGEVQTNGSADSKVAVATATVSDGDELTGNCEEIKEVLAAVRRIEEAEAEEAREEKFDVVTARRGRRQMVAAPTGKQASVVAESSSTALAGSNMWALLSDNDPGHGGAKPAKQGKKSKIKKKKNAAEASKQVDTADDGEVKETPASAPKELEEELSEEEEEEMTGEADTVGSRCLTVAKRACEAAVVAVGIIGLYFALTLAPSYA
jgi:hypothetical protein